MSSGSLVDSIRREADTKVVCRIVTEMNECYTK